MRLDAADQTPQKFREVSESGIFRVVRMRNSVGLGGGMMQWSWMYSEVLSP